MSITEMVSAIQQIQTQLAALNGTGSPAAASSASGTASTSSSSFASALSAASADTTGTTGSDVTGQDVVNDALKYVGTPYVLGGESTSGMDCSGLVQKTFSDLGISVPRLVHEQATVGTKVDSLKDAKPGDIITLNGNDHVVIYMGNNTVIHAPYEGRTVSVQKVWFDQSDITSIRRIVPEASASASATTSASSVSAGTIAAELADASQLSALTGNSSDLSSLLGGTSNSSSSTSSTSNYLSTLLNSMGVSGATGSSTASQLLAARAALLQGSAS